LVFDLLFFFLRDRHVVLKSIAHFSPLSQPEMDRLFSRIGDTIHATVYGTFAIAAVQGFWADSCFGG
jgi:predicted PurR-regulated permease PerM